MRQVLIGTTVVAALGLAGCAPVTIDSIREGKSTYLEFEVSKPYKTVYTQILQQTRLCYLDSPTGTQLIVSDKRSNADKDGYITVKHVYGDTQEHTMWLADVKSLGENRTQVKTYYTFSIGSKKQAQLVEQWVVQGSQSCKA